MHHKEPHSTSCPGLHKHLMMRNLVAAPWPSGLRRHMQRSSSSSSSSTYAAALCLCSLSQYCAQYLQNTLRMKMLQAPSSRKLYPVGSPSS